LFFSFPNLGIQHVTKKNVKIVLQERYLKRHIMERSFTSSTTIGGQAMNIDFDSKPGVSHDEALAEAVTSKALLLISG
jgi:hypothetical protein